MTNRKKRHLVDVESPKNKKRRLIPQVNNCNRNIGRIDNSNTNEKNKIGVADGKTNGVRYVALLSI